MVVWFCVLGELGFVEVSGGGAMLVDFIFIFSSARFSWVLSINCTVFN